MLFPSTSGATIPSTKFISSITEVCGRKIGRLSPIGDTQASILSRLCFCETKPLGNALNVHDWCGFSHILNVAKLVEGPEERPLKARLVTGELAKSVSVPGVRVEGATEKDLVPIPLELHPAELFFRLRVQGFVRYNGFVYGKLAVNFLACLKLAAIRLWLRDNESTS